MSTGWGLIMIGLRGAERALVRARSSGWALIRIVLRAVEWALIRARVVGGLLLGLGLDSPVPRGSRAHGGLLQARTSFSSCSADSTHPKVPSPPPIKMRKLEMSRKAYSLSGHYKEKLCFNYIGCIFTHIYT